MKRLDWKYLPIAALFTMSMALAPVFHAQDGNTVTRVRTDPPDAFYTVDGTSYSGPSGSIWPAGSKHILYAQPAAESSRQTENAATCAKWEFGANVVKLNPVAVTASSSIPEFVARFDVAYALSLVFFDCPDPANCSSPGTIYVNNSPYYSSQDIYFQRGLPGHPAGDSQPGMGFSWVGRRPTAN